MGQYLADKLESARVQCFAMVLIACSTGTGIAMTSEASWLSHLRSVRNPIAWSAGLTARTRKLRRRNRAGG